MKYYRVKKEFNGTERLIKRDYIFGKSIFKYDGEYVRDELYTPSEIKKFDNGLKVTEEINIPKTKTYWFFGCRFEDNK